MAISPERYFLSRSLLFPKYDRMHFASCPDCTSDASPAVPAPALLETAVRLLSEWTPRRRMAAMRVSRNITDVSQQGSNDRALVFVCYEPAVPHSPNPELNTTEPLFRSATASSALLKSLFVPLLRVT